MVVGRMTCVVVGRTWRVVGMYCLGRLACFPLLLPSWIVGRSVPCLQHYLIICCFCESATCEGGLVVVVWVTGLRRNLPHFGDRAFGPSLHPRLFLCAVYQDPPSVFLIHRVDTCR